MRIDKLEIRSAWKNLENFKIDFNESHDIAVLIGRNGSAKSNLIETIIKIFIDINLGNSSKFAYSIEYFIKGSKVHVHAEVDKLAKGEVDGKHINYSQLRTEWTPYYLIAYYSGSSPKIADLFDHHDILALRETLEDTNHDILRLRRFTYAHPEHGLFALLAFYLSEDKKIIQFLQDYPRIEAFDSALLVLHKPTWAKQGAKAEDFWGASGPVRDLLFKFRHHSLAPFATLHQRM